jgi:hypothetical protein
MTVRANDKDKWRRHHDESTALLVVVCTPFEREREREKRKKRVRFLRFSELIANGIRQTHLSDEAEPLLRNSTSIRTKSCESTIKLLNLLLNK